jgi:opacity protein-like surface antigen
MRHGNMRSLAWRVAAATTVLATCATTGFAQGTREIDVRVLGGATRFSPPMRTVSDLRLMVNTNRNQISSVLAQAGIAQLSTLVLDTLTTGDITDATIAPDTHLEWMALKRAGTPDVLRNVRWSGRRPFDAFQFTVESAGYTYTFVVPKVCGNLSLVSRTATPVAAIPEPPPAPPAPEPLQAPPEPPPAPAPVATSGALPPAAAPAPAPSGHYNWTATGFVGAYFGSGGDASSANDVNESWTYGGQISRMWGFVGAEFLADFAPKYKIESLFLSEHPEVNSYMANAIARWGTHFQDHFEPYVSGGVGGIQMHTSFLPLTAISGATDNAKVYRTRFGWNIGAGGYAFAGRTIGLRADVRYFKATTTDTFTGTAVQNATDALLSGIDFWRANIGVAFRW